MKTDGIKPAPKRRSTRNERSGPAAKKTAADHAGSRIAAKAAGVGAQPGPQPNLGLVEKVLQQRLHIQDPLNPEFADLCRRVEEALSESPELKSLVGGGDALT